MPVGEATKAHIGIACDFLFEGGAEMVIDTLRASYPGSDLYTAIYDPTGLKRYPAIAKAKEEGKLNTSPAQMVLALPFVPNRLNLYHFYWLYFITSAFHKTKAHDVVIYSCAAQSKLIRVPSGTPTIVYFHTPTRWLYPGLTTESDLAAIPKTLRRLMAVLNGPLRALDQLGIRRLKRNKTIWLCNSSYTKGQVRKFYGIECQVVFPPIDTATFSAIVREPKDFFLYNGRLTFQKRVDVAIRACLLARKRLMISGQATSTELQQQLESIVADAVEQDPTLAGLIVFLGRTSDEKLRQLLSQCVAMIFPPREDFGIAPIEAMASGVPVIAYKAGGALDYLREHINGRFFESQTPEALAKVLESFEVSQFHPKTVADSIPDLSIARFKGEIQSFVDMLLAEAIAPDMKDSS